MFYLIWGLDGGLLRWDRWGKMEGSWNGREAMSWKGGGEEARGRREERYEQANDSERCVVLQVHSLDRACLPALYPCLLLRRDCVLFSTVQVQI